MTSHDALGETLKAISEASTALLRISISMRSTDFNGAHRLGMVCSRLQKAGATGLEVYKRETPAEVAKVTAHVPRGSCSPRPECNYWTPDD